MKLHIYLSPIKTSQNESCWVIQTLTNRRSLIASWFRYSTAQASYEHHLLNTVADLIDSMKIKTTQTDLFTPINAENLRKAHKKLESGNTIGKIVLSGF